jgi:hypothetical protein
LRRPEAAVDASLKKLTLTDSHVGGLTNCRVSRPDQARVREFSLSSVIGLSLFDSLQKITRTGDANGDITAFAYLQSMKVTMLFNSARLRRFMQRRTRWGSSVTTTLCIIAGLASCVTALAQPVITKQPQHRVGLEIGTETSFSVEAVGTDQLEYQWRLNGVNILGATGATLEINGLRLTDCGSYSVAIADSKGAVNSQPALLLPNIPLVEPKDFFADRFEIGQRNDFDPRSGFLRTTNKDATKESGEPDHAEKKGTNSIWFRWIAPESGIVRFNVRGSGFDTLLAAYTGESVDKLEPVSKSAQDDDGGAYSTSEINFNAVKGTDYAIAIDGYEGAQGNTIFHWDFEETFEMLPIIIDMPTNRTVTANDEVILSVDFEGQSGRWFHNGQPTENTSKTFRIDKADPSAVGRYSVVIGDGEGRFLRTVPADIQINISDDPIDLGAFAHDKFMASSDGNRIEQPKGRPDIAASSGPARGYTTTQVFSTVGATKDPGEPNHAGVIGGASEWYTYVAPENGTMQVNTDGSTYDTVLAVYTGPGFDFDTLVGVASNNVPGAAGGDHVLFEASAGTIYYIAVDGVGGASGTVQLNINLGDPAEISSQPANRTVGAGTNATFSVTASGMTPLNYQWQFNSVNIANATNSTYTRLAAQVSHAGPYRVVVSNAINVVTSSVATLTVLLQPAITAHPANRTVSVGTNVSFSVTATGSATLRYQWREDGVNISNATNATLSLTNVQSSHAGSYTVVVTNSVGAVTSNPAVLTVLLPPQITAHPTNQTVVAGTNVSFSVTATGTAPLRYQWRDDGVNISNATNATLSLTNVQSSHAGSYTVVVTNSVGAVTSNPAVLTVNTAPFITSPPRGRTVGTGESITLFVTATGNPTPTYQWRLNGAAVAGATASSYQIANFQAVHEGTYRVVVSNSVGSVTSASAILALNSPPRFSSAMMTNGSFRMTFIGVTNVPYILKFSTNLTSWSPISTNSSTNGFLTLLDTNISSSPLRFYQVISE